MVTLGLQIKPGALEALKKNLEVKLAKISAEKASEIYNKIVTGSRGTDYPYWSGQYMASWSMNIGSPEYKHLEAAGYGDNGGAAFHYAVPKAEMLTPATNPYTKIYITNAAPHAYKVEHEGTPTHDGGWYVAISAKNSVVMKARFF